MKKRSGLYDYLETNGVLGSGSVKDIAQAKKQYWKKVRKEWRKQQRKECKSYTIYLKDKEQRVVARSAVTFALSITRFIKDAAIQKATNSAGIDDRIIGKIREAFFEKYNDLQEQEQVPKYVLDQLLQLQITVLTMLRS
jgi:hypothetical protein